MPTRARVKSVTRRTFFITDAMRTKFVLKLIMKSEAPQRDAHLFLYLRVAQSQHRSRSKGEDVLFVVHRAVTKLFRKTFSFSSIVGFGSSLFDTGGPPIVTIAL